ncbi:MAG TPA: hypothetical protein VFH55_11370 [Nitrospiria bacterium]|nr:hypothetical protein [Nitrospiria bacterium]
MEKEQGRHRAISLSRIVFVLFIGTILFLPPKVFGLELQGFSDITYTGAWHKSDLSDPDTNGTVALGELDFFIRENLSDRVDFLTEFNFSADPNTNVGSDDIERLQIGYIFNDALTVRAGRFHNVLSYWNMTYHHGRQLYTSIDRPDFLHFEDDGGLVPTHVVGLWIGGLLDTRMGGLEYNVMGGNGPRVQNVDCSTTCSGGALSPNSTGDDSKNKAVSFNLQWMPRAVPGLAMGISGNMQQLRFYGPDGTSELTIVAPDGSATTVVSQGIYGVNLEYLAHKIEFLSEGYQFRDHNDESFTDYAWYAQLGYKIINRFTPYTRFERVIVQDNDPYFVALGTEDMSKTIVGLRFDIIPTSSLKAEVRFVNQPSDNWNEFAVQWAFAF